MATHHEDLTPAPADCRNQTARYLFEGAWMTVRQVHELVPALTLNSIRRHLQQGRATREELLNTDFRLVRKANGMRAARRFKSRCEPVGPRPKD